MIPTQNTRLLLQWIYWLSRSLWWRQIAKDPHFQWPTTTAVMMTGWVKTDFRKWKLATFQA